jgi:hypothetical protein
MAATAPMHTIQVIALSIGLAGFAVAFVLQFRLRHHVSADRVRTLLDRPSKLYPHGIPPRAVLDERGQRLLTIMYVGGGIFMASILVMIVLIQTLPHVAA